MSDRKRMLPASKQRVLKVVHSLFAKVFGIGLIVLLALMIGRLGAGGSSREAGDQILVNILRYVVNPGLLGAVATSFIYALFTPWGFFRHRWIVVKWIILAAVLAVMIFGLAPTIIEIAAITDGGMLPASLVDEYRAAVRLGVLYCGIEVTLMIALSVASYFKPGKRRK
jgi:hypothetical protein